MRAPSLRVALRVLQEVDDLDELVLGLVDPGDVLEGDPVLLAGLDRRAVERPKPPSTPPACRPSGGA